MAAELSIEQVIHVLFKRIAIVLLIPIITAAATGYYSWYILKDVYQASSTVMVSSQTPATMTAGDYSLNVQLVDSYSVLCKTNRVLNQVIAELGLPLTVGQLSDKISVTASGDTEIIHILVKDEDPLMAQSITNTLTRVFQDEVKVIMKMDNVQIIDEAQLPDQPVEPNRMRNLIFGVLGGLVIGLVLAFMIEFFDRSVRTEEQLSDILKIPVLGSVPKLHDQSLESANSRTEMSNSAIFGKIMVNIDFSFVRMKNLCLMVTSSIQDEGKTTVAARTAAVMAASGKKTLLIDTDMRSASLHLRFNCTNTHGLSDIISQSVDWRQYLIKTGISNLYIITAGRMPTNTMKYVGSPWFKTFLEEAKKEFDYVVLDTPPLLSTPDSQIISSLVDGVILVVKSGKTTAPILKKASGLLKRSEANLIGTVLNSVKTKGSVDGYGYGRSGNENIDIKRKDIRKNSAADHVDNHIERMTKTRNNEASPESDEKEPRESRVPANVYCVMSRTGAEQAAAVNINTNFPELTAIAPVKIMQEKRQSRWEKREQSMLPGYIFIYTNSNLPLDLRSLVADINKPPEHEKGIQKLTDSDAEYAKWIYRCQGKIGISKLLVKDDGEIQVIEGPLLDFKGMISKVDKNKRRAVADFFFDGQKRSVSVGVECILPRVS